MKRINIHLTEKQITKLKARAKALDRPVAQVVRDMLDDTEEFRSLMLSNAKKRWSFIGGPAHSSSAARGQRSKNVTLDQFAGILDVLPMKAKKPI